MVNKAMVVSEHLDPEKTRGDLLEHLRRVQAKDSGRMPDRDIMSALFTNLCEFVSQSMRGRKLIYWQIRWQ